MRSDWKNYKIGDLCKSISETYNRNDSEVILINTSDVLNGKILNHEPTENRNLRGQFKKTFKKDDILYSEIRPANKRYAYVDFDDTEKYIASTKLMVLRPNIDLVLPRFLFAWLTSNNIIAKLQHLAETRSGTFPQITFLAELAPLKISLPPLTEQEKISSILSLLDDKIELNNRINENLEQQARAIFKEKFLSYNSLPEGWNLLTLGDIAEITAGGDKPKIVSSCKTPECPYPIFSNGISNKGLYGYTSDYKIKDESVTVSARGTIGFVCLRTLPYTPIVRLITLVPNKNIISAKYLYMWLKNISISGTGTTQQQLTIPDFRKTKIVIPNAKDMISFTEIVTPFFELIGSNLAQNERLAQIRDSLLPKLISGELDISGLDL